MNYLNQIPKDIQNIIFSYVENISVINVLQDIIDINIESLFVYKYPKLYSTVKRLLNKKILSKKYENCFDMVYEAIDFLDYDKISQMLNGIYIAYNIEMYNIYIPGPICDILYTCFIYCLCNKINNNLMITSKKNMDSVLPYCQYNSMHCYLTLEILQKMSKLLLRDNRLLTDIFIEKKWIRYFPIMCAMGGHHISWATTQSTETVAAEIKKECDTLNQSSYYYITLLIAIINKK